MRELTLRNFDKGLYTTLEAQSIPEQAASRSLNWLTLGDKIELSGGYSIVGTELTGSGRVTGLEVAEKVDGTLLPFRTRGRKIEYYSGSDWTEIGTDTLPVAASGEDVAMAPYTSLAGYQMWLSSPSSSLYKIMLANPGTVKNFDSGASDLNGYITIIDNRLLLWNRSNNRHYIYGSYKDLQNSTTYTNVTSEAVGSSGSTSYSGTLTQATGNRTVFNISITDGTTTLSDDKNGNLTGTGGSGTINYATGAYSVTFSSPTVGSVTANYSYEDSASHGLADFSFSSTRTAAQGFFLPQATGGDLMTIMPYQGNKFCLHERNAWLVSISTDDLTVTNQEFRQNMGTANWRAAVPTGEGVYYINVADSNKPRFELLTLDTGSSETVPIVISFNVDLTGYDFSSGVGYRWNDYILFVGKTIGATANNRLFAYNLNWKSFDVLGYYVSVLTEKDGELWAGDSATNNVQRLFHTVTANGANIENYWEGKLTKLEVDELKKFKRLTLRGQIAASQELRVSLSYDNAEFQEIGRVDGEGSYVSSTASAIIGGSMVGVDEVGGGGTGITAFNYVRELRVRSAKFDEVKIRIEALDVGYASVSEINYYDIKTYGQKNLRALRST